MRKGRKETTGREMVSRDEGGNEVMGGRPKDERAGSRVGGRENKRIIDVGKGRSKKRTSVWIMEMQVPR